MDCLKQKTKFRDVDEKQAKKHQGMWENRTPSEAAAFWEKEFSGGDAEHHDNDVFVPETNI
jgi:hypothetical protein